MLGPLLVFIPFLIGGAFSHCGPSNIPSITSEEIARDVAMEVAKSAEVAFKLWKNGKIANFSIIEEVVHLACTNTMALKKKREEIAHIFSEMDKSPMTKKHLFSAEYEINRFARWTKDLAMIGLEPWPTVDKAFKILRDDEKRWAEASRGERTRIILDIFRETLCSSPVNTKQYIGNDAPKN